MKERAIMYVEGYVLAVPRVNKQKFIDHAKETDAEFMKLGATRILECWEDDVKDGKLTDFRRAVQATKDEAVVFAWVEWPDKATRDAAIATMNEAVKSDERLKAEHHPMPFDGKRLIYGGFAPVIILEK